MADSSTSPLVGVWDRFMTPGRKVQAGIDPETGEQVDNVYDFSAETFAQMVRNFSETFSERRLSLDLGNHIASVEHTEPVELARYSGLAAVVGGQVIAFWDQFPDLLPPDPAALLMQLQQKFPRATSADGMWGYRREVTPAGEKLIPNMHQISPFFAMRDKDEEGNPIGPSINNVSPVYIAHQNGTVLMSKPLCGSFAQPSSGVHAPRPIGDTKMADKADDKKDPKDAPAGINPEMRKMACAKFGLPDSATDGEIMAAFVASMGGAQVEDKDKDGMGKAKMGDELPGQIDGAAPNTSTNFSKAQETILAQMRKRTEDAEREAAEAKRLVKEQTAQTEYAKFAKDVADSGRWADTDEALRQFVADLGGDLTKARTHIERMPVASAFGRLTEGGHPAGAQKVPAADSTAASFSKRSWEIYRADPECIALAKKAGAGNAGFALAQQKALAETQQTTGMSKFAWQTGVTLAR